MRERTTWDRNKIARQASRRVAEDPRAMNSDHFSRQPSKDKYNIGGPSEFGEDVHPSTDTWEAEYDGDQVARNAINMPEFRPDTFKQASEEELILKADLAAKVARLMLRKASESAVEDQAVDLMHLKSAALIEMAERLAAEQEDADEDEEDDDESDEETEDKGQAKQARGRRAQQQADEETEDKGQAKQARGRRAQQQADEEAEGQAKQAQQQQADETEDKGQAQAKQAQQQADEEAEGQAKQAQQQTDETEDKGQAQAKQAQQQQADEEAEGQAKQAQQQFTAQQVQQIQALLQQALQQVQGQGCGQQIAQGQQLQQIAQNQQLQQLAQQQAQSQWLDQDIQFGQDGVDSDIEFDGNAINLDESPLGPEDAVLNQLFASEEVPAAPVVNNRTASVRTLGVRPTNGVSQLGGVSTGSGSNEADALQSLWSSAPDVREVFR